MSRFTGGVRTRLSANALLSLVAVLFVASPSYAQVDVGGVTDSVNDTADSAKDTVNDTTSNAGDSASNTTDNATDSVDNATGGATEPVTDAVDNTVENTTDSASEPGDKVDAVTNVVEEVAKDPVGTIEDPMNPVKDAVDAVTGGSRRNPLEETLNQTVGEVGSIVDGVLGSVNKAPNGGSKDRLIQPTVLAGGLDGFISGANAGGSPFGTSASSSAAGLGAGAAASANAAERSFETLSPIEKLIETAREILPKVAFPMVLLALVAGFLVVQNRVDRNDPKLALAPLDVEQEFLSFR